MCPEREQRLTESVELLASLEGNGDTTGPPPDPEDCPQAYFGFRNSPKSDEKEMPSFFAPRSSLKKAPIYSERHLRRS